MPKFNDFEIISKIGCGSYGTCYKVKYSLNNKIYVWKQIDVPDDDDNGDNGLLEQVQHHLFLSDEIKILQQLNHPNIIKYYDYIISDRKIYIIMEYCSGGDLLGLICSCRKQNCRLEEQFIWTVIKQLSSAIQFCHNSNSKFIILHRDIKPENVFLDVNGNIKLGDFGSARLLISNTNKNVEKLSKTFIGTPLYMSPEVITKQGYNHKADVWSLGCLCYQLCNLKPPFTGDCFNVLKDNITNGYFNRIKSIYSDDLQTIITVMLNVNRDERPTIEMLLQHPIVLMNLARTSTSIGYPRLIESNENSEILINPPSTIIKSQQLSNQMVKRCINFTDNKNSLESKSVKRENPKDQISLPLSFQNLNVNDVIKSSADTLHYNHPKEITQEIFNETINKRLHALQNFESNLLKRELAIKKREQIIRYREKVMRTKKLKHAKSLPVGEQKLKTIHYDDSLLTIEPNDTIPPVTCAKFDVNKFQCPVQLQSGGNGNNRKVTFEHLTEQRQPIQKKAVKADKKPFILRLFNRKKQSDTKRKLTTNQPKPIRIKQNSVPNIISNASNSNEIMQPPPPMAIPEKWTNEKKRTVFEMLAIMNASKAHNKHQSNDDTIIENLKIRNNLVRHDRKRQSMYVIGKENISE